MSDGSKTPRLKLNMCVRGLSETQRKGTNEEGGKGKEEAFGVTTGAHGQSNKRPNEQPCAVFLSVFASQSAFRFPSLASPWLGCAGCRMSHIKYQTRPASVLAGLARPAFVRVRSIVIPQQQTAQSNEAKVPRDCLNVCSPGAKFKSSSLQLRCPMDIFALSAKNIDFGVDNLIV